MLCLHSLVSFVLQKCLEFTESRLSSLAHPSGATDSHPPPRKLLPMPRSWWNFPVFSSCFKVSCFAFCKDSDPLWMVSFFLFLTRQEMYMWFRSTYRYLVFPVTFVKEAVYVPMFVWTKFVKNCMSVASRVYFQALYFMRLLYMSVSMPLLHCFCC